MASERRIPVPEGRKDKRRSFLPTPKSFATPKESVPQDYLRQVVPVEHSRPPLQVGDKVCISGIKLGNLCYFGKTHIAPGIWCGIELDEPEGKHDGQVEGVRYFNCRFGHGIFAPVERVARVEVTLHDLHNEIIEEESEVVESPVDNTPTSHVLQSKPPPRRLLPQPQVYVRRGSKEQVDIPTKIDEQNEDFDEVDSITDALPPQHGKSRVGKRLPTIQGDKVRRVSLDPASVIAQPCTSIPSVHSLEEENQKNNANVAPKSLNSTYSCEEQSSVESKLVEPQRGNLGGGKLAYKPSRLPGFSKLPQIPKPDTAKSTQNIHKASVKSVDNLNSTYTLSEDPAAGLEVNNSSSDECLSGEIQECLDSDRRQFLNLTFDNESGSSPPLAVTGKGEGKVHNHTFAIETAPVDLEQSELTSATPQIQGKQERSADFSLGIVDLNDTDLQVSRLQESQCNSSLGLVDVSKKSSDLLHEVSKDGSLSKSNLTDYQKLSKVSTLSKRQSRVASLGDGFDANGALTSTPLIAEELSKSRVKGNNSLCHQQSNSSLARPRLPSTQEEVFDSECGDFMDGVKANLDCAFDIIEEKEVEIEGVDTLDWRQEASDEDEARDKINESDEEDNGPHLRILDFTHVVIKDPNTVNTGSKDIECSKDDSLIEKFNQLEIENIIKPHLNVPKERAPMTDSGISEFGDGQSMAGSTEMGPEDFREEGVGFGGPEEEGDLETLLEDIGSHELQLQADLVAGHLKKDRPLSLYSATSADTGYVPDTDSERGTMTANSPQDWTQKMIDSGMGQSSTSVSSESAGVSRSYHEATGLDKAYAQSFKNFQSAVIRGNARQEEESDSDMFSDTGTMLADNDTIKDDSESLSHALMNVKGLSAEDLLPLEGADQADDKLAPGDDAAKVEVTAEVSTRENTDGGHTTEVMEDERTEADQQQDLQKQGSVNQEEELTQMANPKLNVTVDITCTKEDNSVVNEEEITQQNASDVESVEEQESGDEKNKKEKKTKGKKYTKKKKDEKVEHKKPNIKVGSRLADYIKSPLPTKPKEEKENTEAAKNKRNLGYIRKIGKTEEGEKGKSENAEEKKPFKREKIEKEPPKIIKRAPPKSKWDAIMSKIEDHKTEPPPKKEIKSTLSAYLNASPPVVVKKEVEPKPKKKLPAVPTPDYSKVKSKLNLGSAAPVLNLRRESSPGPGKRDQSPRAKPSRNSSISSTPGGVPSRLDLNDSQGSSVIGAAIGSGTGSMTELNTTEGDLSCPSTPKSRSQAKPTNPAVNKITERERRESTSSTVSETSQSSVKAMTNKNSTVVDVAQRRKSMPARSTIPKQTNYQNRNKTKTKNNQKPITNTDVIPPSSGRHGKQEITRLEALCESRTKELNFAKIQMKSNLQAFDAMSVLVDYLANELNAFSCPALRAQLETLQQQLSKHKSQIEELELHKSKLEDEVVTLTNTNENTLKCLQDEHEEKLTELGKQWQDKIKASLRDVDKRHEQTLADVIDSHEKQIAEMRSDHAMFINKLKITHEEEVASLRSRQEEQMEELHKQHRDKLEDITNRFEGIKVGLSEKVDTLRSECDDLRQRARISEEALLRDSDVKVQMALSPYMHLPKEIDSLKLVIEMRNEDIQKLRNRNMELEKQAEELLQAKEKIISQKQKIENLEAIISMKTDHEKQLHDKCQMLMKKYDKESKANKRLSMDFEELVWKVNKADPGSLENLSKIGGSPCTSENASPVVMRRKLRSPALSDVEKSPGKSAVYRRSTSSSDSPADKKMKRRSANFLYEKERTSPTSPLSRKHTSSESSSPPRSGLHPHMESPSRRGQRMAQSLNLDHTEQSECERMVQSCNDADVFEAPQGLPNPPTPEEVKSSLEAAIIKSQGENIATKCGKTSVINPNDVTVEFSLPLNSGGIDLEEFEGEGLHLDTSGDTREETSDLSHSTESNCQSDVTSGTGSMIWDYEKMDSIKSMDSSHSSQVSDTILDGNSTLTESQKGDSNSTLCESLHSDSNADLTQDEGVLTASLETGQQDVRGSNSSSVVSLSPKRKPCKESTV